MKIMAQRRPRMFAKGALKREPKKAPADKIDTISDVWLALTSRSSSFGLIYPVEKPRVSISW
jgi:hypothetical protein